MKTIPIIMLPILFLALASVVSTSEMRVSPDTAVFVNGVWTQASQLKPGDIFITPDGKSATVETVEDVNTTDNMSCYGFLTAPPAHALQEDKCTPDTTAAPHGVQGTPAEPHHGKLLKALLALERMIARWLRREY